MLNQIYDTGLLKFSLILLAITIIAYPTIRKYSEKPNSHKRK